MDCGKLEGETLDQRYQVQAKLGQGGMGIVYRALDLDSKEERALKVIDPRYAHAAEFQQRFQVEARTLKGLNHPGLVKVYHYSPTSPCPYLVMELISGPSLFAHLKQQSGQLSFQEAVSLVYDVCQAVAHLHRQNPPVLHRDIKPSNILLQSKSGNGSQYRPVLTDFGLVKLATTNGPVEVGRSLGTPGYMSPEQARDSGTVDQRSDIFSLGVLLYHLTTGRLPFETDNGYNASPSSPGDHRPNIPDVLEEIILKAIALDPAHRHQTVEDLSLDLEGVMPLAAEADRLAPPVKIDQADHDTDAAGAPVPPPPDELPPSSITALDRIRVFQPDGTLFSKALTKPGLTIGRSAENNLVLDSPTVADRHARIDFDGKLCAITDLDSHSHTDLDDVYLLPNQPYLWESQKWVRIGDFYLLLERDKLLAEEEPGPAAPREVREPDILSEPAIPFAAIFNPRELSLVPGKVKKAVLVLANNRQEAERFELNFQITFRNERRSAEEWLRTTRLVETVSANSSKRITLPIVPPPLLPEGDYYLTVIVTRASDPGNPSPGDTCWLKLQRRIDFNSTMEKKDERRQVWSLVVENLGNARESLELKFSPVTELYFYDTRTQISLNNITIHLEPLEEKERRSAQRKNRKEIEFRAVRKRRHQFGEDEAFKFKVEVVAKNGTTRQHQSEFISRALTPAWLPIGSAIMILIICLALLAWVLLAPGVQLTGISPEFPAVGEPITVRWDSSGLLRQLNLNGTPVPPKLTEYTLGAGLPAGKQSITLEGEGFFSLLKGRTFLGREIKIPTFLLQRSTSTWTIGVREVPPTPVIVPVVIEEFTVTPEQATPGQVVTLKWRVTNADSVNIDVFGTVLPVGKQTDKPQQTTRYTLTASNQGSAPVQKVITVRIVPPTPTPPPPSSASG